ncbi:MAG: hypothetical protein JWM11_6524 [Planctomycetaceae bacterium]|nr:hypothetical protein [Planctomycetaceae bacterium]
MLERRNSLNLLFKMAVLAGTEAAVRLHLRRRLDVNARDEKGVHR